MVHGVLSDVRATDPEEGEEEMDDQRDTVPTVISLNGQDAGDKRVAAVYRCELRLDDLAETDDPDIRFCDRCQQKVFKVVDFDGFEKAVASKGCVWGPVDMQPLTDTGHYLGGAILINEQPSQLHWD